MGTHRDLLRATYFRGKFAIPILLLAGCAAPPHGYTWGTAQYEVAADALRKPAQLEMAKPLDQRAKDAGVTVLDFASACLASGNYEDAQQAFYQGILITNDLTLRESDGDASLIWDEATKVWQGEAYERAMAEFLHGICLMRLGDFDNARVAFDRALVCDRFSKGALYEREGSTTLTGFSLNNGVIARGGSVFQRDFLAAYVLRTLCYVHLRKMERARLSWQETTDLYRELLGAAQENSSILTPIYWTQNSGRYEYPNVFLPPFRLGSATDGSPASDSDILFSKSIDELAQANCLIIAAAGSRPKKVKVGPAVQDANFIHDDYLRPAESIQALDMMIDGNVVGRMTQCLNLYGQSAGRGPSAKDLSQERKGQVEDFGRSLENSGNNYVKIIGMIVRAANQEEADTRQWTLVPNAIHLWIGRLDSGKHRLTLLPSGFNRPSIEPAWIERAYSSLLQGYQGTYLKELEAASNGYCAPLALRQALAQDIEIGSEGLSTFFIAESYNKCIQSAQPPAPKSYVLLPRRQPGKS